MFLIKALAAISRVFPFLRRTDSYFDRLADELVADPATFFKRHRAKVTVFVASLVVSGAVTVLADHFSAHL